MGAQVCLFYDLFRGRFAFFLHKRTLDLEGIQSLE